MNRFFRRLSRFGKQRPPEPPRDTYAPGTPQDVTSTRAKSSRHKKSTADHWNQ